MQGGWNPLCDGRNAHTTHWIRASLVAQLVKSEWVAATLSCLTLCDPMDCSLPGSSIHGIFQAGTLEWVAISFCRGSSWSRDRAWVLLRLLHWQAVPWWLRMVKNLPAVWENWLQFVGWEDSPGEGHGNPLQCSCLENSMDRGSRQATVHGVTESDTTECGRAYTHTHTMHTHWKANF